MQEELGLFVSWVGQDSFRGAVVTSTGSTRRDESTTIDVRETASASGRAGRVPVLEQLLVVRAGADDQYLKWLKVGLGKVLKRGKAYDIARSHLTKKV